MVSLYPILTQCYNSFAIWYIYLIYPTINLQYQITITFINPLEIGIFMSIIILILGFFVMCLSLFFYKKGMIYWGFLVPPYMRKADKIKDPMMFWLWITILFTISLILIAIGFLYTSYIINLLIIMLSID